MNVLLPVLQAVADPLLLVMLLLAPLTVTLLVPQAMTADELTVIVPLNPSVFDSVVVPVILMLFHVMLALGVLSVPLAVIYSVDPVVVVAPPEFSVPVL